VQACEYFFPSQKTEMEANKKYPIYRGDDSDDGGDIIYTHEFIYI
jgi:hypothetical protein